MNLKDIIILILLVLAMIAALFFTYRKWMRRILERKQNSSIEDELKSKY